MQFTIDELKRKKIWVLWKYTERDGKKTKVPIDSSNGKCAKANDSKTWHTFVSCAWKKKPLKCDGMGLNFAPIDEDYAIFGVDIDGHRTGENGCADDILKMFAKTYIEFSPSGTGFHVIGLVQISKIPEDYTEHYYQKNASIEVECYLSGITKRYFTFTGDRYNIRDEVSVCDVTDELLEFIEKYMKRKTVLSAKNDKRYSMLPSDKNGKRTNLELPKKLDDILNIARRAKNGDRFIALYDLGDTSEFSYDDSRADLALCCMLAFYLGGDTERMDTAFRESALYRYKWEREDYRKRTMLKAIELCHGEFFGDFCS